MEPNFSITSTDIYRLQKPEAIELAKLYRLSIPPNPNEITVNDLRVALALTKDVYRKAQQDSLFLQSLGQLLLFDHISDEDKTKYPILVAFQEKIEPFYERPNLSDSEYENVEQTLTLTSENTYENDRPLNLNSNLQSTINQPQPSSSLGHSRLLSDRKVFNKETLQASSLDSEENTDSNTQDTENTNNLESNIVLQIPSDNQVTQNRTNNQDNLIIMAEAKEQIPLIKPINFSGNTMEDVNEFVHKFNVAAKCNKWTEATKISLLPCYLTSYASKWYSDFYRDTPSADFETIISNLKSAFGFPTLLTDLQYTIDNRIQSSEETPLQYFYVMKHLCKKYNPNMSDTEIINYTTKGLLPTYFDTLMYLDHNNLTEFQHNLLKLETKLVLKKQNSKKHDLHRNDTFLCEDKIRDAPSLMNKTVHFETQQSNDIINAISDLKHQIADLELNNKKTDNCYGNKSNPHFRDNSRERHNVNYKDRQSRSPYRGSSNYRYRYNSKSPNTVFSDNKKHYSKSPDRDCRRQNSWTRTQSPRPPYTFKQNREYNCHICLMDNHRTSDCCYNARSTNFRGIPGRPRRNFTNNRDSNKFAQKPSKNE